MAETQTVNGTDYQIIAIVDRSLYVKKTLEELKKKNKALRCGLYGEESHFNLFAKVLAFQRGMVYNIAHRLRR